jgi:hypothetical protein
MTDYTLIYQGQICDIVLTPPKPRDDGSGNWDIDVDFKPRPTAPAAARSFNEFLSGSGIHLGGGEYGKILRAQMLLVWNARGALDAEAVASASQGSEKSSIVCAAVNAVQQNNR